MCSRRIVVFCLAVGALAAALPGCAGLRDVRQAIVENQAPDVAPQRQKRKEEIARDFDERRDTAQFDAAASRWQQNDIDGCRQMLKSLVQRNPNHRRARMLLADTYVFSGNPARAIEELRKVVELDASDAMAHHALAQALDAVGQRSEAVHHYELATQLEPASEVYALSYRTALGGSAKSVRTTPAAGAALRQEVVPAGFTLAQDDVKLVAAEQGYGTNGASGGTAIAPVGGLAEPHNRQSPLNRAIEALAQGDAQTAIDVATAALADGPDQSAALYRVLGAAHYRRGEYQAAQSALTQALSLDKRNALSYFLMGSTLSKLGQTEAAARHVAEAARLDARFAR